MTTSSQTANDLATQILLDSINALDTKFGEGYSKKNPQLLAVIINTQERMLKVLTQQAREGAQVRVSSLNIDS